LRTLSIDEFVQRLLGITYTAIRIACLPTLMNHRQDSLEHGSVYF